MIFRTPGVTEGILAEAREDLGCHRVHDGTPNGVRHVALPVPLSAAERLPRSPRCSSARARRVPGHRNAAQAPELAPEGTRRIGRLAGAGTPLRFQQVASGRISCFAAAGRP